MNKEELVDAISIQTGFTKKDCLVFVDAFCDVVGNTLNRGDRVKIVNFGVFEVKLGKARTGKNFATNTTYPIPPRKIPAFIPGAGLKEAVGGEHRGSM